MPSANNSFPCRVCGRPAVEFHYGACADCRETPEAFVERAHRFAAAAHGDQKRKYTGEPYITHPEAVARIVATVTSNPLVLAAAYLHDVVEDTPVTLDEVRAAFGPIVARFVEALTDVSRPEDGNRAVRKALDREHTRLAPPFAKTVKLADLIHNTADIVAHDPKFARVFLAEKRALLEVLRDGDPVLFHAASNQL